MKRSSSGGALSGDQSRDAAASASPFSMDSVLPSLVRRKFSLPQDKDHGSSKKHAKSGDQDSHSRQPKAKEALCKQIEVRRSMRCV